MQHILCRRTIWAMATKRIIQCPVCGSSKSRQTLFRTLMRLADDLQARQCAKCASETSFHLQFNFQLGAPDTEFVIAGVFHPRKPQTWLWPDGGGAKVTFYPFLVVLNRKNRERATWLPYWHLIERTGKKPREKYGQWGPLMDSHLFDDLLAQARTAGLLS